MSSPFQVSGRQPYNVYLRLVIPLLASAGLKRSIWNKRPYAFALQSAFQLDPVFSALEKETKENADRAPASTNESFPWAEWMPSPVQPPGQHQHWVNTETNLCEIKTHFYMVLWHQDRRFLPTKQAQLSCYALWPLLPNEKVANSLNPSEHREQETKKSGLHVLWESMK